MKSTDVAAIAALAVLAGPQSALGQAQRHYSAADLRSASTWTAAAADLRIGLAEGAEPYLLSGVGAIQGLRDGAIALTNFTTAEVRIFGPDGAHRLTFGGSGSGPGEFLQIVKLFRMPGDSLATWDIAQSRGPIYSVAGEYARQVRAPSEHPQSSIAGVFGDRSLLILSRERSERGPDGIPSREIFALFRATPGGAVTDSVGWFPGMDIVRSPELAYLTNATFAGQGFAVAGPHSVWLVDGREPRITQIGETGQPITVTTWDPGDRRVTDSEIQQYWDAYEHRGGAFAESAKRRRNLPVAESFPPTGRMLADAEGRVWVQEYMRPSHQQEHWMVFDEGGALLARIALPEGFSLRDVAGGFLYGVVHDEWDVETVERRPLVRR